MLATGHQAICWLAHLSQQQQRRMLGLYHLRQVVVAAAAQMQQMMLMTGCHCNRSAALEQQQLPGE
jgi:hypothetical protein